jgi:hypothetical protein
MSAKRPAQAQSSSLEDASGDWRMQTAKRTRHTCTPRPTAKKRPSGRGNPVARNLLPNLEAEQQQQQQQQQQQPADLHPEAFAREVLVKALNELGKDKSQSGEGELDLTIRFTMSAKGELLIQWIDVRAADDSKRW